MRYRQRVPLEMKLPSHLAISRYGIYYLRIERNGVEKRRSLRTRDPTEALAAAYKFGATIYGMAHPRQRFGYTVETSTHKIVTDGSAEEHTRAMEALALSQNLSEAEKVKIRMDGERELALLYAEVATLRNQQFQTPPKPEPARLQTLQSALVDYLSEKSGQWKAGTKVTYTSVFNRFVKEFGATTLISNITVENFLKYRKPLESTIHPDTLDRDCAALIGWFDWAIKRGRYVGSNPIEKSNPSISIRDILKTNFEKPRNPLNAEDLQKIFTALPEINNPADFWLPILGLFTGARIGELCSARLDGIEEYDVGKWAIYLYGKSPSSKRKIPIHPKLIDCGFLSYINDVKRCWPDADRIFPHLVEDSKNGFANKPTTAFTTLKQKLGLGEDKVFHSFRKTFISCLQYNQLNEEWRRHFVGHDSDDDENRNKIGIKGGDAHSVYSKAKFDPARLAEIVFPAFDLIKWLNYEPPLPVYKSGQFNKYFAKNLHNKLSAAARKERQERTFSSAKAKL